MNLNYKEPNKNKKYISSFILLKGIWNFLDLRRKRQMFVIFLIMLSSGVAELISLGAIVPFIAIIIEPEKIWSNPIFNNYFIIMGYYSADQIILPITLVFIITAIIATIIRSINLFLNIKFAAVIGSDLSSEVYKRTISQPYPVHLKLNSSQVITTMTKHIDNTVTGLIAFLQTITASLVSLGILIGLLIINFNIAIIIFLLITIIYLIFASLVKNKLLHNGNNISIYSRNIVKALQEGLGAIREVLMRGNQNFYVDIYKKNDRPQRILQAENYFLGVFPRFAFEGFGIVILASLAFLLLVQNIDNVRIISLLGAFALGSQRLLPAIQQIYAGWSSLRKFNADFKAVLNFLNQKISKISKLKRKLSLVKTIKFEAVKFRYGDSLPYVLKDINFTIQKGEKIGLIGTTGSGKSTLVDILMALLEPSNGRFLVDGIDINKSKDKTISAAWRSNIAHVPQSIYLADCSVAENIAFGIPSQSINFNKLIQCAKQAQISEFIEMTPHRYKSFIGERGVKLSGGQRQRIGIARALYLNKEILIFDEATSALDQNTENSIMKTLDNLSKKYTIIMIAHRLSTLKSCDRIIKIKDGYVIEDDDPEIILSNLKNN